MAEDDKTIVDTDELSDEDFMKLDVPPAEIVAETEEKNDEDNVDADGVTGDTVDPADAKTEDKTEEVAGEESPEGKEKDDEELTDDEVLAKEPKKRETLTLPNKEKDEKPAENVDEDKKTDEEKKVADAAKLVENQANAASFFEKVSAPFKADGKEVQVRNPEEAIRLMQMGVNYSRRMKEMKPLREMDAMLNQHGLRDPEKLNELIDLSKGSKEAVQKFLKKHNIDPLDLDPSKGDEHSTPNYQSDPKDVAFQEAIDATLQVEGGRDLLNDVNKDWDEESKELLREKPDLFEKLLEQKDTGVYSQINKELLHQRTMGYLANVPFLQAYEQVGNAMQKAGVFDTKEEEVQKTGLAPIASGPRKAAPKPKTELPNPNLTSANKPQKVVTDTTPTEPDYLSMSDEDFMKLGQPPG